LDHLVPKPVQGETKSKKIGTSEDQILQRIRKGRKEGVSRERKRTKKKEEKGGFSGGKNSQGDKRGSGEEPSWKEKGEPKKI